MTVGAAVVTPNACGASGGLLTAFHVLACVVRFHVLESDGSFGVVENLMCNSAQRIGVRVLPIARVLLNRCLFSETHHAIAPHYGLLWLPHPCAVRCATPRSSVARHDEIAQNAVGPVFGVRCAVGTPETNAPSRTLVYVQLKKGQGARRLSAARTRLVETKRRGWDGPPAHVRLTRETVGKRACRVGHPEATPPEGLLHRTCPVVNSYPQIFTDSVTYQ